jgi:FKBP-type peptidyl-prolyl cis-trans isomerase
MNPKEFYLQHFNTDKIPFFSLNDSVVKIYFKLKQVLTLEEFNDRKINLASNESKQIESYFKTIQDYELSIDSLGFYWIEKPNSSNMPEVKQKSVVKLSYEGSFLNGRIFEKSPDNFELIYGIPDQIIKGLNYVIKKLKKGQNAKIILPSRLAFGENGSSNGIIAPYTPLIYKVNIIDIKNE